MPWIDLTLAVLAATLVVGLPGVLVALGLRLRGLWLAATTPLLGMSAIVVASLIGPWIGLSWSFWVVLLIAAPMSGCLWLLTWRIAGLRPRPAPAASRTSMWITVSAIVVAAVFMGIKVVYAVGAPDLFAQAFDNVFHLNAIRAVLDGGDASPFAVARLSAPAGNSPYPSAWHALGALIVQLSGASIPISANAALLVVACFIWPIGAIALTRTLFGGGTVLTLATGILSTAFGAYPLLLIGHIGAYPLVLSIALVPVALAIVIEIGGGAQRSLSRDGAVVLLALSIPGILGAHPSSAIAIAVFSIPVAIVTALRVWRQSLTNSSRRVVVLSLVAYCLGVLALIVFVRPSGRTDSPASGTAGQAIGEALTMSMGGRPLAIPLALLTICGAIAALRLATANGFAAVGIWLTSLALYVVAAGADEFWRLLITGPWYTDGSRLAALAPATAVPLAAFGTTVVWRAIDGWLDRRQPTVSWLRPTVVALCVIGLVVIANGGASRAVVANTRAIFLPTDSAFVSVVALGEDEREVIARAADIVSDGDVIVGDPLSGSSFAYALTGHRVLLPHINGHRSAETLAILEGLSSAVPQDPACLAANALGVRWVLDFQSPIGKLPRAPVYPGLEGLGQSSTVNLVERVGDASLYEIVGCSDAR